MKHFLNVPGHPLSIGFVELPEPLRVGGLEDACRKLEHHLQARGQTVCAIKDADAPALSEVDLVHFHGLWSPTHLSIARACQQRQIPYIVSPHGMLEPWALAAKSWKKKPYLRLFENGRLERAQCVLATAQQEAIRLRGLLPKARIQHLPLGGDFQWKPDYYAARQQLNWQPDEVSLLYLSRIHPKKGLRELLQALQQMLQAGAIPGNLRLTIVGEGPEDYVSNCKVLAKELEPHLRIDFLPPIWSDEKWRYLQAADLMCLPTYSENFGLIVLEACQVGTPVLTTQETPWGLLDLAGHGFVGKPGVEGTVAQLKRFFLRGKFTLLERQKLSKWAHNLYAWDKLIDSYIALYNEVLADFDPAPYLRKNLPLPFGEPHLLPVSAVIATRHRHQALERTLRSMAGQSTQPAEVIIVDASEDADTQQLCQRGGFGLRSVVHYHTAKTPGAASQRNEGVHFATQPYILFVDDDVFFGDDCLKLLYDALQHNRKLGGANATIINQQYTPPGRIASRLWPWLNGGTASSYAGKVLGPAYNLLPEDRDELPSVVRTEWMNTTCVLYRADVLPQPPFPQHFTGYSLMEDLTLSATVAKEHPVANARTARIYHDSQPGSHKKRHSVLAKMELVNRYYVTTRVLGRTRGMDMLKLAVVELYKFAVLFGRPGTWLHILPCAWGKLKGLGSILLSGKAKRA